MTLTGLISILGATIVYKNCNDQRLGGRYEYGSYTVVLCSGAFAGKKDETDTLLHELGHLYQCEHLANCYDLDEKTKEDYAKHFMEKMNGILKLQ